MQNKKIYWLIAILVIVLLIVLAVVHHSPHGPSMSGHTGTAANQPAPQPASTVVAAPVTAQALSAGLPANFPTESGSKILESQQLTDTATGQVKLLRTMTTAKSLADNLTLYQTYLSKNGWTITKTTDVPTLKAISATKSGQTLDITISYDGGSKSDVVVVSYTEPK